MCTDDEKRMTFLEYLFRQAKKISNTHGHPRVSSIHLLAAIMKEEGCLSYWLLGTLKITDEWIMRQFSSMGKPPHDLRYVMRLFRQFPNRYEDRYTAECLVLSILPMPFIQDFLNRPGILFRNIFTLEIPLLKEWISGSFNHEPKDIPFDHYLDFISESNYSLEQADNKNTPDK